MNRVIVLVWIVVFGWSCHRPSPQICIVPKVLFFGLNHKDCRVLAEVPSLWSEISNQKTIQLPAGMLDSGNHISITQYPANVHYLLRGSVDRWNDQILITWQLWDLKSGHATKLMSKQYPYQTDHFAMLIRASLREFHHLSSNENLSVPVQATSVN